MITDCFHNIDQDHLGARFPPNHIQELLMFFMNISQEYKLDLLQVISQEKLLDLSICDF